MKNIVLLLSAFIITLRVFGIYDLNANNVNLAIEKCQSNYGTFCHDVGLMYANGDIVEQNYSKAIQYYKKPVILT